MAKNASLAKVSAGALLYAASIALALAQTLTIGVRGGPDSIDPHFTATGTHAEALKHVFDTLVWSGDGLELEPRLAESWKALNDTTWKNKLRTSVKFSVISDVTAADVTFYIAPIPALSKGCKRISPVAALPIAVITSNEPLSSRLAVSINERGL